VAYAAPAPKAKKAKGKKAAKGAAPDAEVDFTMADDDAADTVVWG